MEPNYCLGILYYEFDITTFRYSDIVCLLDGYYLLS